MTSPEEWGKPVNIGIGRMPDRKRPALYIEYERAVIFPVAYFRDVASVQLFVDALARRTAYTVYSGYIDAPDAVPGRNPMTDQIPLCATLAELDALRERVVTAPGDATWRTEHWGSQGSDAWLISSTGSEMLIAECAVQPDADLIALEHNTGPRRDAMLERAAPLIRVLADSYCSKCGKHPEHLCERVIARAWLADYEGARDE